MAGPGISQKIFNTLNPYKSNKNVLLVVIIVTFCNGGLSLLKLLTPLKASAIGPGPNPKPRHNN